MHVWSKSIVINQKPKLLIVDDQPNNLHALKRLIDGEGLDIYEANSGFEALKLVLEHDFFLILMDVQMPEMNGFEAAELILNNKRTCHMPIIFLTAISKSDNYVLQGYDSGAVDYLYKPIEEAILSGKIRIFKELWNARSELKQNNNKLAMKEKSLTLKNVDLKEAYSKINILLNSAGDGILGINTLGEFTFVNPKACVLLDFDMKDITTTKIQDFLLDANEVTEPIEYLLSSCIKLDSGCKRSTSKSLVEQSIVKRGIEPTVYWQKSSQEKFYVEYSCNLTFDDNENCNGAVILFQDISQRKKLEQELVKMATFDALTNLYNRTFFYEHLEKMMSRSIRNGSILAVLFIDLDSFKTINDTLGHHAGDKLLQQVSQRLTTAVRISDIVARLGGDEFAIILHDLEAKDKAGLVAQKLVEDLSQPYLLDKSVANISLSIGIAIFAGDSETKDELVKRADAAMYEIKDKGKNGWAFG